MEISELLVAMLRVATKARDVARIIRSEPALLHLLVEEKQGVEKNKRFVQDFKTLADVLIQQMVTHDIAVQFPEMAGSIFGEESNQFTNTLGETITVRLCDTPQQTKSLLKDILDDDEEAASLLSQAVHRQADLPPLDEKLDSISATVPCEDVGIWIDPIDSTAQYIRGAVGHFDSDGVTNGGLQCVAVLIGAFQKSTGLPIIGVANQPFWEMDPVTQKWSDNVTWGVCYKGVKTASIAKFNKESSALTLPTIIMSTSESDAVKHTLSKHFQLRFASGAGYKLLCTAQRRVDAYVLSKSNIYLWDCCAPHAILCATGGSVVKFHDTVAKLKTNGKDQLTDEAVDCLQVNYSPSAGGKSIDGIIAYSTSSIFDQIMTSLQ